MIQLYYLDDIIIIPFWLNLYASWQGLRIAQRRTIMLNECFITSETSEINEELAERLSKLFGIEIRDKASVDEIPLKSLQLENCKAKVLGPKEFITAFNSVKTSLGCEGFVGNLYLSGEESNGEINLFFTVKYWPVEELKKLAINWDTTKCRLFDIFVVKTETNFSSLLKAFL